MPLFDGPHVLKGIRNNLLIKDIELFLDSHSKKIVGYASWSDIQTAYEINKFRVNGRNKLPKLNDDHIYLKKNEKNAC